MFLLWGTEKDGWTSYINPSTDRRHAIKCMTRKLEKRLERIAFLEREESQFDENPQREERLHSYVRNAHRMSDELLLMKVKEV